MVDGPSFYCEDSRSFGGNPVSRLDSGAFKTPSPRRSIGRVYSADRVVFSMANRISASASPSLSNGRPLSGVLADDCTLDTVSSTGARVSRHSPRGSVSRRERYRRRESPRTLNGQRLSASQQLATYAALSGLSLEKPISADFPAATRTSGPANYHVDVRPEPRRVQSGPTAFPGSGVHGTREEGNDMEIEDDPPATGPGMTDEPQSGSVPLIESSAEAAGYQGMFKQPETNPITEKQLINEVHGIYAGLVMVEKKTIEIDEQQARSKTELSREQWQALIAVHRTLLNEHHDFFLASQHPSASLKVKRLPEKFTMPARMWRYGIHAFLEVLRQRLPASLDYMLHFIYIAYSMVTLLLESVPQFRDAWHECLGDLARYRMAVEDTDSRDRETWVAVSRHWYDQFADRNPGVGRIQHHLAVLSRPDVLQQLFHYTKALVCVLPFPNARGCIAPLLDPYNTRLFHQHSMVTAFLATHGVLFTKGPAEQFITRANHFLSLFRLEIRRLRRQGQQGVYIMSINFASVLQYGEPEVVMALGFSQKQGFHLAKAHAAAFEWTSAATAAPLSHDQAGDSNSHYRNMASQIPSPVAFQGSCLAFHTLAIFLDQMGDPNAYPGVHTSLAFIWCLALHPPAMQQVEQSIPWLKLTKFLNTLFRTDTNFAMVEHEAFPLSNDGIPQQLPEDYLIRGQTWSQLYYPEKFFEGGPLEYDRPMIEDQATITLRRHRCLWLGARIATFNRWISYCSMGKFEATQLAHTFAPTAETCGGLNSSAPSITAAPSYTAHEMFGA